MSQIPADTGTDDDTAKANAIRDRANSFGIQRQHWRDPYFDGSELDALVVFDYETAPKSTKFLIILGLAGCIFLPTALTYAFSRDRFWTLFVAILLSLFFGPIICCTLPLMPPHTAVTAQGVVHAIGWANETPNRLYEFPYDAILDVELRERGNDTGDTIRGVYLTIPQQSTTYLKISRDHCCQCMLCTERFDEELPNGHRRIHLSFFKEFPLFKQLILEFKRIRARTGALVPIPNPDRVSLASSDEEA